VYLTWNGGAVWTPTAPALTGATFHEIAFLDLVGQVVGVTTDKGFYLSYDGGKTFAPAASPVGTQPMFGLTSVPSEKRVVVSGKGGMLYEAFWSN